MKYLAATNNAHKLLEFRRILDEFGIALISPSEIGGLPEVPETGSSFEENAGLKALASAKFANLRCFADDSGLVVDELGGAPGIYSARYAADDVLRIERVLRELGDCENRRARFVCVIALADPDGVLACFQGTVEGEIAYSPRGDSGFGYDPIFIPAAYGQTFAELGPELKDRISHRADALKKFRDYLVEQGSGGS